MGIARKIDPGNPFIRDPVGPDELLLLSKCTQRNEEPNEYDPEWQ